MQHHPKNPLEMRAAMEAMWRAILDTKLELLASYMPERIATILLTNGSHTLLVKRLFLAHYY
jgi:hypothetical protein